jgi:hypothetical protein
MSAKKARRSAPASAPATPVAENPAGAAAETTPVAWIDSDDPKKRQLAKIILGVVWVYVAALWLLALDQWFHWGIFGPKLPPVP